MSKILVSAWRRKANHRPRYSVYSGRDRLGDIFESRGIYTAVDSSGNLIAASTAFQTAANALVPATGPSS
jgi:hypothetical protein